MGSTDAQLGSIQQQWNTYKVCRAAARMSDLLPRWSMRADRLGKAVFLAPASSACSPLQLYERLRRIGAQPHCTRCRLSHSGTSSAFPYLQAITQRGWTMPELADVRTKSKALERSGFTMAQSPKLRQSSRSALAQVPMHSPLADIYLAQ